MHVVACSGGGESGVAAGLSVLGVVLQGADHSYGICLCPKPSLIVMIQQASKDSGNDLLRFCCYFLGIILWTPSSSTAPTNELNQPRASAGESELASA